MRFVTLKSEEQLDVQTLHRVRHRPVAERTALTNQIRGILLERGFIIAQGVNSGRKASHQGGVKVGHWGCG